MTREELIRKLNEMNKEHIRNVREVQKQYAFDHAEFKVGDIITDEFTVIKVTGLRFSVYATLGEPYVIYDGIKLTKKLVPRKNPIKAQITANRKITKVG